MSFIPRPREIYKHFKGNMYQVTAVAEHTETGELLVIYQALYGDFRTYARPLEMFADRVDREKYPDVTQEFRFELQGPEAERQREESEPEQGGAASRKKAGLSKSSWASEPTEGELTLDPMVLEFLDADSYEQRLRILTAVHHRITNDMINTMAVSCDIEVGSGDVEERYEALKTCLVTLERYEGNRLR